MGTKTARYGNFTGELIAAREGNEICRSARICLFVFTWSEKLLLGESLLCFKREFLRRQPHSP
jgi:hypothetical protein